MVAKDEGMGWRNRPASAGSKMVCRLEKAATAEISNEMNHDSVLPGLLKNIGR